MVAICLTSSWQSQGAEAAICCSLWRLADPLGFGLAAPAAPAAAGPATDVDAVMDMYISRGVDGDPYWWVAMGQAHALLHQKQQLYALIDVLARVN